MILKKLVLLFEFIIDFINQDLRGSTRAAENQK